METNKKYKIAYVDSNHRYSVTIPKALMNALSKRKGQEVLWKLHPNGKDLVMEFER